MRTFWPMTRASDSPGSPRKPRSEVSTCYGHLSGLLADQLCQWLIAKEWIAVERLGDHAIDAHLTPEGRRGLAAWGVSVEQLEASSRKPVALCHERYLGQQHEHVGAYLGTLLREWLEGEGIIEREGGALRLSESGRQGLIEAGMLKAE